MKRILDFDPVSGITQYTEYHADTDTLVLASEQDCTALLDRNKALANDSDRTRKGIKEDWWHYATIPNVIIEKWLIEDGISVFKKEHAKRVFQKLNSPEYKYLKTTDKVHLPKAE